MTNTAIVEDEWQYVLNMLPGDLDETAASKLAIVRRRQVSSAQELLRMCLAYGLCDLSLRRTAAWARAIGICDVSDVAVMKRLQGASDWLGHLVLRWMQDRGLTRQVPKATVRVLDATVVCEPGSKGTDWRLHLGIDLSELRIISMELTGPEGGETLARHKVQPEDIVIADRGYGHRGGVASVLDKAAHVLIRINWHNFPLETVKGQELDIVDTLELLEPGEIGDWQAQFRCKGKVYPVRLVAIRKSRAAAEKEQRHIRGEATRKGRAADPRSLRAAHFIYVITDLPSQVLPAAEALELYRLRWQIEMSFKRLKGILRLDRLRAHDARLARTYLYAKILGALIVEELCERALSFSPWGYPIFPREGERVVCAADAC